jgi:hypothetical protein
MGLAYSSCTRGKGGGEKGKGKREKAKEKKFVPAKI